MEASWHQNRSRNRCYLRKAVFREIIVFPMEKHSFLRSYGSKLTAKTIQKSIKIQEKSMPRCHPSWTPFFNRFLIDFYSQLRLPESQKSSPRCSESTIFQKIAFRNWHRFLIDFGANLAPFCLPKSTKILSKIDPKSHQKNDRFLHRFFIDF